MPYDANPADVAEQSTAPDGGLVAPTSPDLPPDVLLEASVGDAVEQATPADGAAETG